MQSPSTKDFPDRKDFVYAEVDADIAFENGDYGSGEDDDNTLRGSEMDFQAGGN